MTRTEQILEDNQEFHYRYTERIGMMVGTGEPTTEQKIAAFEQAENDLLKLKV